ncbi:MAG: hypothetical protein GF350_13320 [Chitinivibrionales bacterium]|nr:hypothetical protein [Chitinivibrionales bacterium]
MVATKGGVPMMKKSCFIAALACISAFAGPNENATVSIDMDPTQADVQNSITTSAPVFDVLVMVDALSNLDTYSFRLIYHSASLEFVSASWGYTGTSNILVTQGGSTIGMSSPDTLPGNAPYDTVEGYITLLGEDDAEAPDGAGLLAAIQFNSLVGPLETAGVQIVEVDMVDSYGETDFLTSGNFNDGEYTYEPVYTIAASAGANGAISPEGDVSVAHSGNQLFEIRADSANGYIIDELLVDDNAVGAAEGLNSYEYDFSNVTSGHTISAGFALATYTLTMVSDGNGTTAPGIGDTTVEHNDAVAVAATPSAGYHFVNWSVTGPATVTDPNSASTTVRLTGAASVQANFAINTYTLTMASDGNGTTAPAAGDTTVEHDDAVAVAATPSAGYHFVNWSVTGPATVIDPNSASTTVRLTGAASVQANFEINTYTLTVDISPPGAGSVARVPDKGGYDHGESVTLTATAGSGGWYFAEWQGTPINGYKNPLQTITMDQSYTITAVFEAGGDIVVELPNALGNAAVFLFASSGSAGEKMLDGPGRIDSVVPGNHLLCVVEDGFRPEYVPVTVQSGATATVSVEQRPVVPFVFDTTKVVTSGGIPVQTGSFNSAAIEDMDNDGDKDLLIGRNDGSFDYYANTGADYVSATDPRDASGADLIPGGGIVCLRVADWNSDGKYDLMVLDGNNTIRVYKNISRDNELVYDNGAVIYTLTTGNCTGFDISLANGDEYPDLVMGMDDGSVVVAYAQTPFDRDNPSWAAAVNLTTGTGNVVAGLDAAPCMMDISGDGAADLLVGTAAGDVLFFRNRTDGTYQNLGALYTAGHPMNLGSGTAIGKMYGPVNDFLSLVMSDGNGQVYTARGWLRGDFNRDDTVRVEDLSIFGDSWHKVETDAGWEWITNLNLSLEAGTGNQIIDVQDLSVFGDSWHKVK